MKTKTKALILAVCAVLLVVTTVFATVAFLTSTATVTNTFTFGKVAITLDETDVDVAGAPIAGAARVIENEYHLLPGHEYTKDPTIHVAAGSENCWLFVKLDNGLKEIIDSANAKTVEAQMAENGWTLLEGSANVYWYGNVAAATNNIPVFGSFKIKGEITNDVIGGYGDAKIVVVAYAVQADGFTSKATPAENAKDAWTAAQRAGNIQ